MNLFLVLTISVALFGLSSAELTAQENDDVLEFQCPPGTSLVEINTCKDKEECVDIWECSSSENTNDMKSKMQNTFRPFIRSSIKRFSKLPREQLLDLLCTLKKNYGALGIHFSGEDDETCDERKMELNESEALPEPEEIEIQCPSGTSLEKIDLCDDDEDCKESWECLSSDDPSFQQEVKRISSNERLSQKLRLGEKLLKQASPKTILRMYRTILRRMKLFPLKKIRKVTHEN